MYIMKGYDLIIPVNNEKNIIKLIDYIFICSKNFLKILICYDNDQDITLKMLKNSKYINSQRILFIKNLYQGPCEAVKTGIKTSNANCKIVFQQTILIMVYY